ncbi:MAG: ArsR/SmtB family transcription factor [Erythrobacter sp.]
MSRDPAAPDPVKNTLIEQFKAVAHPLRLCILEALAARELNVGEIEAVTAIGQPALSQQLGVLRKAGLVDTRKEAKLVFYRLAPARIDELRATLAALAPTKGEAFAPMSPASPVRSAPGVANFARLS